MSPLEYKDVSEILKLMYNLQRLMEPSELKRIYDEDKSEDKSKFAVNLVNELRGRAFGDKFEENKYTTTTLTLDELLAERGREFAYEGHRRTDLIRFGKYLQPRWEKESTSDATRILFPIPQTQRDINTNLKQNDGY